VVWGIPRKPTATWLPAPSLIVGVVVLLNVTAPVKDAVLLNVTAALQM